MVQKLMYSREEVARALGLSLRLVDRLISNGRLAVKHIGRRVLISQVSLYWLLKFHRDRVTRFAFQGNTPEAGIRKPRGQTMTPGSKLLRVNEAAERLNLSPKTIWAMIYRRDIEVVRIGRSVRIAQDAIDRLIERGTVPATRR